MEQDAARRLAVLGRAPELVGVGPWFNTPDGEPLRLAALCDLRTLLAEAVGPAAETGAAS